MHVIDGFVLDDDADKPCVFEGDIRHLPVVNLHVGCEWWGVVCTYHARDCCF